MLFANSTITSKNYEFNVSDTFWGGRGDAPTQNASRNIDNFVEDKVKLATIALTLISTVMVVLWGIWMISSGGNSERSEKGKKIISWAIIGVILGLLSYMIIVLLWNILW